MEVLPAAVRTQQVRSAWITGTQRDGVRLAGKHARKPLCNGTLMASSDALASSLTIGTNAANDDASNLNRRVSQQTNTCDGRCDHQALTFNEHSLYLCQMSGVSLF